MSAFIITGLQFGDEGKGSICDAIVARHDAQLVVRYNGGAQCAHNVVTERSVHHTFAQFGSGTLIPGVKTLLSKYVLVNPLAMQTEAKSLEKIGVTDALARMHVDRRALMTTPYHRALNRLRELARGDARHGSCGMGIGETAADALARGNDAMRIGDIDQNYFLNKMEATRSALYEQAAALGKPAGAVAAAELATFDVPASDLLGRYRAWKDSVKLCTDYDVTTLLCNSSTTVFEGAQGVLLDETHGFNPHTTWSTTTSKNAHALLREHLPGADVHEIGVLRTFTTRHGQGPHVTGDAEAYHLVADDHNAYGAWQGRFRAGWFDAVMLDYALKINRGVDSLALTHADKLAQCAFWKACVAYADPCLINGAPSCTSQLMKAEPVYQNIRSDRFVDWVVERARTNVSILSYGPGRYQKHHFR